jgi:hypothetical protein
MKNLPIGIQSFEDLRTSPNNYIYVDKTEAIYRLVTTGKVYFLSRPRRFGKSMLISTLDALFSGKRNLFDGLYIADKWDWMQCNPVIRIDWTQINHATPDKLDESLVGYLKEVADRYELTLTGSTPPDCFRELIYTLHEKTGRQAVVLIDEYDKPITSHLFDEYLTTIKTSVHDFYQVIKGADEHIRFVFLTGVSKCSGLSIFSALNNLNDITMNKTFSTICGYTQEELESHFSEYIDIAAQEHSWTSEKLLDAVKFFYDGYSWDSKTFVYNPFSTLRFFSEKALDDYWFKTGTPTFLIEMLQRQNKTDLLLENVTVKGSLLDGYTPESPEVIPLLFQTGYLTVKDVNTSFEAGTQFTLGIPNFEVKDALLTRLLLVYGQYPMQDVDKLRNKIAQKIRDCDEEGFAECLETMVAYVPNELKLNCEAHYHALMLIWLRFMGFEVHAEVSNNYGRSDAVWKQPGLTVVAELKYSKKEGADTLLDKAMKQIHDKKYYNQSSGRILLLGIAFAGEEIKCRMEVK